MSIFRARTSIGTRTTPPPSPVSAPSMPATEEIRASATVKPSTLMALSGLRAAQCLERLGDPDVLFVSPLIEIEFLPFGRTHSRRKGRQELGRAYARGLGARGANGARHQQRCLDDRARDEESCKEDEQTRR